MLGLLHWLEIRQRSFLVVLHQRLMATLALRFREAFGEFHDQVDAKWIVIGGRLEKPAGVQENRSLTNVKGPKILFFIAGIFVVARAFYYRINYRGT
jgi:hypothetical protein